MHYSINRGPYLHGLIGIIRTWISNHTHRFLTVVITHTCPNFNGGLTTPPVKSGHKWKITSHWFTWMYIISYPVRNLDFLNSLTPGKFEWNFRYVIFKQILLIDGWGIFSEIALIWMSQDFTDDQSTLVQVMVWCRQATSHYLSQSWPGSLSSYGVTKPQWVDKGGHRRQQIH